MKMKKTLLSVLMLTTGLPIMAMEQNANLPEEIQVVVIDNPESVELIPYSQNGCYDLCLQFLEKNKKIASAAASGILALSSNILWGAANAPATVIFLGMFGTSIKGILPKSADNQALKVGIALAAGAIALGTDIGLKQLAGFDTHWAFSNLALVGGMATLKRIQKGHIKGNKQPKVLKIKDKEEQK